MIDWKNNFKFYTIFSVLYLFYNSSIIFNRDEVGIDSGSFLKNLKESILKLMT